MAYNVDLPNPSHDIVLRDANGIELGLIVVDARGDHAPAGTVETPVEQSALKTSSGNQSYSDLKPPYAVLAQETWEGGRGGKTFEEDVTRFWSSARADTGRANKVILGGRETYGTGYRESAESLPGSMRMIQLLGTRERMGVKFTDVLTMNEIWLHVAYVGAPGNLKVELWSNSANRPLTMITEKSVPYTSLREERLSELFKFDQANTALSGTYWVVVYGVSGDANNYWMVGVKDAVGTTWESADDGGTWSASVYDLYYRVADTTADMDGIFFDYEGYKFFMTQPSTGASELWVNGFINGDDVLEGGGNAWMKITLPAAGGINVPSARVTDLVVVENMVIVAQGAAADMAAFKLDAGVWSPVINTGFKATYLQMFNAGDQMMIVRAHGNTVWSAAEPTTWTTPPSWANAKSPGFSWESITGLAVYATDEGSEAVWVMKDSGPWEYDGENIKSMAREEMRAIRSAQFGKGSQKSDVYLFMPVMNTVWRYYSPTFDDVGPMNDDGLPEDMRGIVTCVVPYPGRTLIAVDAGTSGYSTILENNGGSAWHEKYRAPKGERIYAMSFQSSGGTGLDKLWIRQGADFVSLPYPSEGFDPKQDDSYTYVHECAVELGDMYAGLRDAWKYWKSLKLVLEDLETDTCWVEADYRLEDGEWTPMPNTFTVEPIEEQVFGETDAEGRAFGVSSKKFKLRVRLYSTDTLKSPAVRAILVNCVTVVEPKFIWSQVCQIGTHDLNGKPDPTLTSDQKTALVALGVEDDTGDFGDVLTPSQKVKLLKKWSGTAKPLWMRHIIPAFDEKAVFLAPTPNRTLTVSEHENEFEFTGTVALQEA